MIGAVALCIVKLSLIATTAGLFFILLLYVRKFPLYVRAAQFHGPKALPFIGNILQFLGDNAGKLDTHVELGNQYKSPVRLWLGYKLVFGVYEPEQLKAILNNPNALNKVDIYDIVQPLFGTGLITAPAKKWHTHRKLIAPTLNLKILETYVNVFAEKTLIMIDVMAAELHGKEFNTLRYITPCTMDMAYEVMLGIRMNAQTDQSLSSRKVQRVFKAAYSRLAKAWLCPQFIFNRTATGKIFNEGVNYFNNFTDDVIRKKKLELQAETRKPEDAHVDDDKPQRKCFLHNLLNLSKSEMELTDTELRDEINTMTLAAKDSVTIAMHFIFFVMANFPDVQEKVYKELYEIYGASDPATEPVRKDDLSRMEYLECVIKETLRLFPIAPVIGRYATEDINIGSLTLPKGSDIIISIFAMHRKSEYWPDPLKFDPDRFLPENSIGRHPYSFIPFSAGPRNCIGARYGMFLMKTMSATVLRRYILKKYKTIPLEDISLKTQGLMYPSEPLTLFIEKRIPQQ